MEQSEKFRYKFAQLESALTGLKASLDIQLSIENDIVKDIIKNGQVQKFEYTFELFWKLLKKFLLVFRGVDVNSPKLVLKESFDSGLLDEKVFGILNDALIARNSLSHIYNENYFEKIHSRLPEYHQAMKHVYDVIAEEAK